MSSRLIKIFEDEQLIIRIKRRLPYLFQIAELESSRAGRVGMEVGSVRERIIIALLMYKFGEENVNAKIPITESEVDVELFGEPISIKTTTGKNLSGVKLIWTVDAKKSEEFLKNYFPRCDLLLIQINWNSKGGFFYIPIEVQRKHFDEMGRKKYIRLPKPGTNPRGVEITKEALKKITEDENSRKIEIEWNKTEIDFNPYQRWIDLWRKDQ